MVLCKYCSKTVAVTKITVFAPVLGGTEKVAAEFTCDTCGKRFREVYEVDLIKAMNRAIEDYEMRPLLE